MKRLCLFLDNADCVLKPYQFKMEEIEGFRYRCRVSIIIIIIIIIDLCVKGQTICRLVCSEEKFEYASGFAVCSVERASTSLKTIRFN